MVGASGGNPGRLSLPRLSTTTKNSYHARQATPYPHGGIVLLRTFVTILPQGYSEAIRSGCNHIEAEEIAREELCRGLHFSPYNTLVNILWREFEAEIPEDTARQAALRLLPLCRGVLEKYDLTDDFADTPDYELFYTELTGTVQILLEDGIQ